MAKMTPDVTAARAERARGLGLTTLVVQLRAGIGQDVDADVQTDHLAAGRHGYHPIAVAAGFNTNGGHVVTYLLELAAQ